MRLQTGFLNIIPRVSRKAFHIKVYGKVQGVGFRYYTRQQALECAVTGYVRNRDDGSVEIHAEGSEDSLESFLEWCHSGPSSAHVIRLEYNRTEDQNHNSFEIQR